MVMRMRDVCALVLRERLFPKDSTHEDGERTHTQSETERER